MSIAGTITRLQFDRRESNYRLAKEIGVHQTTVKNWKSGACAPQYEHLKRIADHYGVTVDELMKEE